MMGVAMQQVKNTPPCAKLGFTLIEMAIVLLVIGLLVGGILTGKTFVANAELRSMMTESQVTIDAFNQFTKKYHSVPGDYNLAGCAAGATATCSWPGSGAANGDGNGIIRAGATANDGELFGAWQHLALAGYIKGSYTGLTNGGTAIADIGNNVPQSVMSGVGYVFNHTDELDGTVNNVVTANATYFDGKYGHVLQVAGDTAGGMPSTGFLTPARAQALDDKFDDGAPGRGWITVKKPTAAEITATSGCASTNVTATAIYNVALTTKPCYFFLNIPGS
jgi:prepilin-type N-terminal cleavage/methylation domain-containing protein